MVELHAQSWKKKAQRLEKKGRSPFGSLLRNMYRVRGLRPFTFRIICALEGGTIFSRTLREILRLQYDVNVGIYSYGPCLRPGVLPPGTRIGNYCSIADGLKVLRRNHPVDRLSLHPFFFNRRLGLVLNDSIRSVEDNPLTIGHDAWIGANVIIAPGCQVIGNGAVVAAGAMVADDVSAFAIVGGVPAQLIRWRFPVNIQQCIEESRWWLRPLNELVEHMSCFELPINEEMACKLKQAVNSGNAGGGK